MWISLSKQFGARESQPLSKGNVTQAGSVVLRLLLVAGACEAIQQMKADGRW